LRQALQELASPAYVTDSNGTISWLNPACIELVGDRRGTSLLDVVPPEHRALAREHLGPKPGGAISSVFDLPILDRDDRQLVVRVTSAPLRRGGAVVGIFGILVPLDESLARAGIRGAAGTKPADLTPRQLEVLRLLGEGLETKEISTRLGISEDTARNHIAGLLRGLGVRSRLEAVLTGLRLGLLGRP
jgi:DNA-binding CsgD family transcriptional regulator